ncbi:Proteophosphoglycan ppg4 [Rhodotorula toruloides ATCC 204091]|uniref:Proteophosphoglycan ppg4 n=1 Tax=Rhodotorula toruloides TaxID=5286 RepID=A0A0K3CTU7_RHOTO|nr:Proteophosphoglycan ppg4 [Rhodotorula toruloides ATCC 204091]PRQ70672.1 Proteophosphoglycan ppg4 [Rhodotorula toruloides]
MSRYFDSSRPHSSLRLDGASVRLNKNVEGTSAPEDRANRLCDRLEGAKRQMEALSRSDNEAFTALALSLFEEAAAKLDDACQLVQRAQYSSAREDKAVQPPLDRALSPRHDRLESRGQDERRDSRKNDSDPYAASDRDNSRKTRTPDLAAAAPFKLPGRRDTDKSSGRMDEDYGGYPLRKDQEPVIKRPSSSFNRRDPSPPPSLKSDRPRSSSKHRLASRKDEDERMPDYGPPRPSSQTSSRVLSPPVISPPVPSARPAESDTRSSGRRSSVSRFFATRPSEVKPTSPELGHSAGDKRPSSRSSAFSQPPPAAPPAKSRTYRDMSDTSDDDDFDRRPSSGTRPRSRSVARSRTGHSEEARKALEMASAPPSAVEEDYGRERRDAFKSYEKERGPPVLSGAKVARALAKAASEVGGPAMLVALATVSKEYGKAANEVLYGSIVVDSPRRLDLLNRTLDSDASLGELVKSLTIRPLDGDKSGSEPESFIKPLRQLISHLPNLVSLDEDFTTAEWDVRTLTGQDYPLTSSSPSHNLVFFRSAKNWWEVGALYTLLQSQSNLKEVVIGGAAMDRDWQGSKLLSTLSKQSPSSAPARNLESLEISEVMHEDTLPLLLRATGGIEGKLQSLRIGLQSIGSTDDDTPRASIAPALTNAGSTLTHLAVTAPTKSSDDTTGLVDELVAVLPRLEILEWSEGTDVRPVPLASPRLLTQLPKTIRVLRARSLISVSTGKMLAFLDEIEQGGFKLQELDERHIARIEDAAADLRIKCRIGKGDDRLAFKREQ